jgi:hypothetical protein
MSKVCYTREAQCFKNIVVGVFKEILLMKLVRSLMGAGLAVTLAASVALPCFAKEPVATTGEITGKTVGAGLLSLLIWPGIGQALNSTPGEKVATHAIIGILPPYRFWSGYDALVNRKGGYWKGRI